MTEKSKKKTLKKPEKLQTFVWEPKEDVDSFYAYKSLSPEEEPNRFRS
jgi:hypothetical protein